LAYIANFENHLAHAFYLHVASGMKEECGVDSCLKYMLYLRMDVEVGSLLISCLPFFVDEDEFEFSRKTPSKVLLVALSLLQ